jgi:hypothetical protein
VGRKFKTPDFVGIGVMKSASSWTWQQLKDHPQIGVPRKRGRVCKEMHFIDRLDMTLKEYLNKFAKLKTHKVGEYTPNYICCPYAPEFIKTYFPNAKLFAILRNPTDRAFSHYKDHLCYRKIPKNVSFINAFWDNHPKKELSHYSIKAKGMYGDQLEKWYKFFGPEQFKVFFYDDLSSNPLQFLQELYEWVEVENYTPPKYQEKVVKKYNLLFDDMVFDEKDRQVTTEFYKPQIQKLEELTKRKLNWY